MFSGPIKKILEKTPINDHFSSFYSEKTQTCDQFSEKFFIGWTSSVDEDNVGVKSFKRMGAYEFIDASAIDHCVGFIEIDKVFYIVDKEVDSDE